MSERREEGRGEWGVGERREEGGEEQMWVRKGRRGINDG